VGRLSLRARLIAGMGLVVVVLVVVSAVVTMTTRARLIDQVDRRLAAAAPAERGPGVAPDDGGDRHPQLPDDGPRDDERVSDLYQGFVTADGELVTLFTPNIGDEDYPAPDLAGFDPDRGGRRYTTVDSVDGAVSYRVLIEPFGGVAEVVAAPIDDVESTIARLVWVEVLGSLAILAALALVGWWVVHLGIRPVKQMTLAAGRIATGELGDRVPETSPPGTESGDLALALNRMLDRIDGALAERAASEARLRRFVADASHELRTPLTAIRGYAELYRHGGLAAPAALEDAMRRTEQEAARLGRLVDDLLTLARLDEQRPLAEQPVDLAALVRDVAADARAIAPDRPIDVAIDPPLGDGPVVTIGDDDRLRQVLANVVANALVHTDAGVAIHVRLHADANRYVVEVADEGVGMPPDVAARATERFFRADPSRARDRGGSGLGLSIVDAAVAAHGGEVTIESAPGAGTTVRIALPALA
jgi:two-component system OmpR family sensor kinase